MEPMTYLTLYSTLRPLHLSYRTQRQKWVESLAWVRQMLQEPTIMETEGANVKLLVNLLEQSIELGDSINRVAAEWHTRTMIDTTRE